MAMMGTKTQILYGKIDIWITSPVINQPDAVMSTVMDVDKEMSNISISYVSLFKILPIGVVSK
jgi:hypothetical protein